MIMKFTLAALSASALLAGCAGYENTTRDAAVGGAVGAAAGAAIGEVAGGEAGTGALVGGAVGAAAGAARGCQRDNVCPWNRNNEAHSDLRYDRSAQRSYYVNQGDGCTYWQNGQFRSC
ncbi:MAG: glycine zipper domain-containing protein [Oceanicaulis sp.]